MHQGFTGHMKVPQEEQRCTINLCCFAPSKKGIDASSGLGSGLLLSAIVDIVFLY
jgi:hypothetical protein